MADKSVQDEIMPLAEIKQVLHLATKKKLGCAFGLSKDKSEILLLIEKTAKSKKAAEQLKKDGKAVLELSSLRFGEVNIDEERDPGTVRFTVNRAEAGGTITLMTRLIKKAGYTGIVINADPGLEHDGDEAAPATEAAPAAAQSAPPSPPQAPPVAAAAHGGDQHEGMWEAPKDSDGPKVAFAKSSQLWRSCRSQMQTNLGHLKSAVLDAYADEPEVQAVLRQNMGTLDEAFSGLDDRLDDALDAAINASDPAQRAKLAGHAKDAIAGYIHFVSSDPRLKGLDDNPFAVHTAFRETLTKVLTALVGLSKSMH